MGCQTTRTSAITIFVLPYSQILPSFIKINDNIVVVQVIQNEKVLHLNTLYMCIFEEDM